MNGGTHETHELAFNTDFKTISWKYPTTKREFNETIRKVYNKKC
jgi:hypothetical protein